MIDRLFGISQSGDGMMAADLESIDGSYEDLLLSITSTVAPLLLAGWVVAWGGGQGESTDLID